MLNTFELYDYFYWFILNKKRLVLLYYYIYISGWSNPKWVPSGSRAMFPTMLGIMIGVGTLAYVIGWIAKIAIGI